MAEGATHVDMFHDIRKSAFTLAEVLVTLGIIGVVAAMTLPMLANKYQFFVRQQQFKKAYAILNIAVQKAQIDMGEGVRCYYDPNGTKNPVLDCDLFFSELVKNLPVVKTCDSKALANKCISKDFRGGDEVYLETQGGNNLNQALSYYKYQCASFGTSSIQNNSTVYMLNSGASIITYYNSTYKKFPIFLVDINGTQKPNKWGYDIFVFQFTKKAKYDSIFFLDHNSRCHSLDRGGVYTKHFVEYLYGQNAEGFGSTDTGLNIPN